MDQLSQPIRRHGEHIQAVIERERREKAYQEELENSLRSPKKKIMSTSLTNLSGSKYRSPKLTDSYKKRTSIKNISQSNLSSNEQRDLKEKGLFSLYLNLIFNII